MAALELPKELIIEIISIGKHHQGWVLHGRFTNHPRCKKEHREALTATLRMPHHSSAPVARLAVIHAANPVLPYSLAGNVSVCHAAGTNGFLNGCVYGMKLMVARDDLVHRAGVRVLFKHNEVLKQIQKAFPRKHALDQHLKL